MPDDKNKQDARDRNLVAGTEEYEVQYLSEKLGVSREEVIEAIKTVGGERQKVEEYLTKM